jgi:hypothetical protein
MRHEAGTTRRAHPRWPHIPSETGSFMPAFMTTGEALEE